MTDADQRLETGSEAEHVVCDAETRLDNRFAPQARCSNPALAGGEHWPIHDGNTVSIQPAAAANDRVVAGRYRLLRSIGEGASGMVYEARDETTLRRCALKWLSRMDADPNAVRRFVLEARTTAQIESDHIVQVFDAGIDASSRRPYLAMELLRGETLQATLKRVGRLEPEVAQGLMLQAALGLAKAHKLGVVHRDVKPANLFLAQRDSGEVCVKVLDFGIAKVRAESGLGLQQALTASGGLLGTPQYMSPEQVRGAGQIDASSDVWSLGVVLFEMLSGRLPYAHVGSLSEQIVAVLTTAPPPVSHAAPWLPPDIARVVDAALSKEPAQRYPDAEAFRVALAEVTRPSSITSERLAAPMASAIFQQPSIAVVAPPPANDSTLQSALDAATDHVRRAPSGRLFAAGLAVALVGAAVALVSARERAGDARVASPNVAVALPHSASPLPSNSSDIQIANGNDHEPPLNPSASAPPKAPARALEKTNKRGSPAHSPPANQRTEHAPRPTDSNELMGPGPIFD